MTDELVGGPIASHRREVQALMDDFEEARACSDPVGNKKTRLFRGGLRYRYFPGGRDGLGRELRFAYTTRRNVAGYFLGFREVVSKHGDGYRDGFFAHRRRKTVRDRARLLAERQRAKR